MSRGLFLITSCLCSLFFYRSTKAQFVPNVPVEIRSLDEIYSDAQREQCDLRVVGGGDAAAQYAFIVTAFEQRFPNVALNLTVDLSKYLDSQIDRSFYTGSEYVDVALLQQLNDFTRWKAQNRLLYYKPANFSDLANGYKDLDGAYLPTFVFSFGSFYYDYTKLSPDELPNTYNDLLDPKWKGRLVLTYPNDDDAINYLFSTIISKYGFGWLEALQKQDVQWVRGSATASRIISEASQNSSDRRVLTFTTAENYTFAPNLTSHAPNDQYISWYQAMGIFASTKCPESAKLFVSWLLSDEFQQPISKFASTPLNHLNEISGNDIQTSNITQVGGYEVFIRDRPTVEWWRFQYETTLGPPQGPDPTIL